MEDSILTPAMIFEQLTLLQRQLAENAQNSLHRLSEAIDSLNTGEEYAARYEQIDNVCAVFLSRESTFQKMLDLYEKMYNDVRD